MAFCVAGHRSQAEQHALLAIDPPHSSRPGPWKGGGDETALALLAVRLLAGDAPGVLRPLRGPSGKR
jgi:hypothetical protein